MQMLICYCENFLNAQSMLNVTFFNVDGAMHFIYSHKYNTNSAEDSSDMN